MSLKKAYSSLANNFHLNADRFIVKNPLKYYFDYGMFLLTAQGPKLSYINNFEPEYTKKQVKHNAPIVLSMFVATFLLSEVVKRSKRSNSDQKK